MSENSIEFSLSNSEQRDSWLNSSHRTLDADKGGDICHVYMAMSWRRDAREANRMKSFLFLFFVIESQGL